MMNNLPRPNKIEIDDEYRRETRCPEATPSRKTKSQTPSVHASIRNTPRAQLVNKDKFRSTLSPIGGISFFYALGLEQERENERKPDQKRKEDTYNSRESPINEKRNRSPRSNPQDASNGGSLFKGPTKRSESKSGILKILWIIIEWIGRLIARLISPTPIPASSKKFNKKFNAKKQRKVRKLAEEPSTPEHQKPMHLGFTPMVRRPRVPM